MTYQHTIIGLIACAGSVIFTLPTVLLLKHKYPGGRAGYKDLDPITGGLKGLGPTRFSFRWPFRWSGAFCLDCLTRMWKMLKHIPSLSKGLMNPDTLLDWKLPQLLRIIVVKMFSNPSS